jgi:RNA polymerase sigma-70 factor (ECF subfamily)
MSENRLLPERLNGLLAKAEAGDRRALDDLIKLIRPVLRAEAARHRGERHASSIAQEACLKLARGIANGTDIKNILAYAHVAVRNLAFDKGRQKARRPEVSAPRALLEGEADKTPTASDIVAGDDMRRQLENRLRTLDPVSRQAVEARYYDELTWDGVAARCGLPSGEAARKTVERAIQGLRDDDEG